MSLCVNRSRVYTTCRFPASPVDFLQEYQTTVLRKTILHITVWSVIGKSGCATTTSREGFGAKTAGVCPQVRPVLKKGTVRQHRTHSHDIFKYTTHVSSSETGPTSARHKRSIFDLCLKALLDKDNNGTRTDCD